MTINPQRFLLTGGRAPATLDLARLLRAGGHQVLIAESLPVHLCQYSQTVAQNLRVPAPRFDQDAFIQALVEHIIEQQIDIFIPTCEEIFHVAHHLQQFPTTCEVWCESIERLDALHNKTKFAENAQKWGFSVPSSTEVRTRAQLVTVVQKRINNTPIVLKPVYSRFSSHTCILSKNEAIPESIQPTDNQPWLVQDWVAGTQFCTYSIAKKGKLLLHATYQTEFTAGLGATIAFSPFYDPILQQLVEKWLVSSKLTGQFALDWIYTTNENWIALECNPRLTSGIHLFTPADHVEQIFTNPHHSTVLQPQSHTHKCLRIAMCSYGLRQIHSVKKLHRWLQIMRQSNDILFQRRDPWPLWGQFRTLGHLLRRSRQLQCSLLEASTYDIEWNGE